VTTVAPDREQSATSHSLTLHHPLRARRAIDGAWIVDGTPTDCVLLALHTLLPERPDVCLSGINHGPNMGEDVLYSGTVAAAMEATVMGIPALALSYCGPLHEELEGWEDVIRGILGAILGREGLPRDTLFNVNLPAVSPAEVRGIRVTSLGQRRFAESITRAKDPSGREYYWIGGGVASWSGAEDSDFQAVEDGYVSVTPLHLDLTNYELMEEIRGWNLRL
jgi:5'-nucleotidase